MTDHLTGIPNVGPAVARTLHALGVRSLDDLRGRDADDLFERVAEIEGRPQDPCLLDTFSAIVAFADGGPARPWWEFSRERKARAHA